MTTQAKKDADTESRVRDIRLQMADQTRYLDQRRDYHLSLINELQEYYRRLADFESDMSRVLDRFEKQLTVVQEAEKHGLEIWSNCQINTAWQTLFMVTKQRSRENEILSEVHRNVLISRLNETAEVIQRVHKKSREALISNQDKLNSVLNQLLAAMKTYHSHHEDREDTETRLVKAQNQMKADAPKSIKLAFKKDYEKVAEKQREKYKENKLHVLKARNEYLLAIDVANAAVRCYYEDDMPMFLKKTDLEYQAHLAHIMNILASTEERLAGRHQRRAEELSKTTRAFNNNADSFAHVGGKKPDSFEFLPYAGDEIYQLSAQKPVQNEILVRFQTTKTNLDKETLANNVMSDVLAKSEASLVEKTCPSDDRLEISRLFEDGLSPSVPTKEHRKVDRLKADESYLNYVFVMIDSNNRIARLRAEHNSLSRVLGRDNSEEAEGCDEEFVKRPPQLPPKPAVKIVGRTKIFGGNLDVLAKTTGQFIPRVVSSCVTYLESYGLHQEGLLRSPGSQSQIMLYKKRFEQGEDPVTSSQSTTDDEINVVAGLLKLFFRELEDPLFPRATFDRWIECSCRYTDADQDSWKSEVIAVLRDLPRTVYHVMDYLFRFLSRVTEYSSENMMNAENLAVCVAPTLLPVESMDRVFQAKHLVKNLIIHYHDLFSAAGYSTNYEQSAEQSYTESEATLHEAETANENESDIVRAKLAATLKSGSPRLAEKSRRRGYMASTSTESEQPDADVQPAASPRENAKPTITLTPSARSRAMEAVVQTFGTVVKKVKPRFGDGDPSPVQAEPPVVGVFRRLTSNDDNSGAHDLLVRSRSLESMLDDGDGRKPRPIPLPRKPNPVPKPTAHQPVYLIVSNESSLLSASADSNTLRSAIEADQTPTGTADGVPVGGSTRQRRVKKGKNPNALRQKVEDAAPLVKSRSLLELNDSTSQSASCSLETETNYSFGSEREAKSPPVHGNLELTSPRSGSCQAPTNRKTVRDRTEQPHKPPTVASPVVHHFETPASMNKQTSV